MGSKTTFPTNVPIRIDRWVEALGINSRRAALLLGVTPRIMYRYVSGKRHYIMFGEPVGKMQKIDILHTATIKEVKKFIDLEEVLREVSAAQKRKE